MNRSNDNIRNWIRLRVLSTRKTVALVISTCALCLGAFAAPAAPDFANVTEVSFNPSTANFGLTVSVPKALNAASRNGDAHFDVRVALKYVSATNAVERIDSGHVPIRTGTSFVGPIDKHSVAIGLLVPLRRHSAPANDFSPTATAQVRRAAPQRDRWWCYF